MNTVIFVPTISSYAAWIFCNREVAFKNGVLNAAGKILTGYQNREEAIADFIATQPAEPFALLRLSISNETQQYLAHKGWMNGTYKSPSGSRLWHVLQPGSVYLGSPEKAELTMEIIASPVQNIILH